MSAPDDVRARFEAWMCSIGLGSLLDKTPARHDGYFEYVSAGTQYRWLGYHAAHADPSGKVREGFALVPINPPREVLRYAFNGSEAAYAALLRESAKLMADSRTTVTDDANARATGQNSMNNQLELFPAEEARKRYASEGYVEIMKIVVEAITDACRTSQEVVVDVAHSHEVWKVKSSLEEYGYDVLVWRDPENGSDELTISW